MATTQSWPLVRWMVRPSRDDLLLFFWSQKEKRASWVDNYLSCRRTLSFMAMWLQYRAIAVVLVRWRRLNRKPREGFVLLLILSIYTFEHLRKESVTKIVFWNMWWLFVFFPWARDNLEWHFQMTSHVLACTVWSFGGVINLQHAVLLLAELLHPAQSLLWDMWWLFVFLFVGSWRSGMALRSDNITYFGVNCLTTWWS